MRSKLAPGSEMKIRVFTPQDEAAVIRLWGRCGLLSSPSGRDAALKCIRKKLREMPGLFLVGVAGRAIAATVVADYDVSKRRGWLTFVATDPRHRRRGYASAMLDNIEKVLFERGCEKIGLHVRYNNQAATACYLRRNYAREEIVMAKRFKPPARQGDQ